MDLQPFTMTSMSKIVKKAKGRDDFQHFSLTTEI